MDWLYRPTATMPAASGDLRVTDMPPTEWRAAFRVRTSRWLPVTAAEPRTFTCGSVPIRSRTSRRVPFGTGAAVSHLLAEEDASGAKLFFDPAAFKTLRDLLDTFSSDGFSSSDVPFDEALGPLADNRALVMQLQRWSASATRERLLSQCGSRNQFRKQWHAWFDGLKTLQVIRALTSDGDAKLSLAAASTIDSWLGSGLSVSGLLENARTRWADGEFGCLGMKPLEQVGLP